MVHEALGDLASARSDYKAAKDADPHLRRALGAGNERVRAVASEAGVPLADIEALLAADAASGVIGFESFYDNVHITPEGALLVAAELFRVMQAEGLLPPTPKFSVLGWLAREAERRGELDALSAGDWMGFGFDRSRIALRDPWKYDRLKDELDTRIAADPTDWRALAYRGNIFVHRIGGARGLRGGAKDRRQRRGASQLRRLAASSGVKNPGPTKRGRVFFLFSFSAQAPLAAA